MMLSIVTGMTLQTYLDNRLNQSWDFDDEEALHTFLVRNNLPEYKWQILLENGVLTMAGVTDPAKLTVTVETWVLRAC